jgi:hypothetical protein
MDPPGPNTSPASGSRTKVECAYCGHVMERRNLKVHTTKVHAGLTPKEKPHSKQSIINFKRENSVKNDQLSKVAKVSDEMQCHQTTRCHQSGGIWWSDTGHWNVLLGSKMRLEFYGIDQLDS